jgi:hypothetical protein
MGTLMPMADATLKDVVNAIAELRRETKNGIAELRRATKDDLAKLDAKIEKRFDALDEELTLHTRVHKEIEKDITALKGRPARTAARAPRRPRTR